MTAVRVTVPATSANLGPGFDALGLALELRDTLTARVHDGPVQIEVSGEGAADVPRDESHLVYRAFAAAFEAAGRSAPSIALTCENVIPHARGLGSSSAAIVAGIALARGLGADLDDDGALALADRIEGHPDNVAPAQLGGFTIAASGADLDRPVVARLVSDPSVSVVVFIPDEPVETSVARGLLPDSVPHRDASANTGRAALLVAALTGRTDLLLPATRDWLHQSQRRPAMPRSFELVETLRAAGVPAVISGAGPTVLAFVTPGGVDPREAAGNVPEGWRVLPLAVSVAGVSVEPA